MYFYAGNKTPGLKKYFLVIKVFDFTWKDSRDPLEIETIFSQEYPLWVFYTCLSGCLTKCKRQKNNPFILAWNFFISQKNFWTLNFFGTQYVLRTKKLSNKIFFWTLTFRPILFLKSFQADHFRLKSCFCSLFKVSKIGRGSLFPNKM